MNRGMIKFGLVAAVALIWTAGAAAQDTPVVEINFQKFAQIVGGGSRGTVPINFNIIDTDGPAETFIFFKYATGIDTLTAFWTDMRLDPASDTDNLTGFGGHPGATVTINWFSKDHETLKDTFVNFMIWWRLTDDTWIVEGTAPIGPTGSDSAPLLDNQKPDSIIVGAGTAVVAPVADTIHFAWVYPDTDIKYFILWRFSDTNFGNTPTYTHATRQTLGSDSFADLRWTFDSALPPRPPDDTVYWWRLQAVDTRGNVGDYSDSISAEFVHVIKYAASLERQGVAVDTLIPGVSRIWTILIGNTEGYSPAYSAQWTDWIHPFDQFAGSDVSGSYGMLLYNKDTFVQLTDQTDADSGKVIPVEQGPITDTDKLQINLGDIFPGETAQIRFRSIVR